MRNKGGLTSWEEFEKNMLEQFPFLPKNFTQVNPAKNLSWVGDYVQKQLQKSMPADFKIPIFNDNTGNYELHETHRSLIVRLPVSDHFELDHTKISVNRNKLRIVLPSGENRKSSSKNK
ncbi:hypothetical protein HMSSN036_01980 [Paenibacillus macerans]|nr:hypothetical protein HMSSN036_01980 [Paenibacillus macerans]